MLLIILGCALTAALAAPQNYYRQPSFPQTPSFKPQPRVPRPPFSTQNPIPIISESSELNPDGSFSYSYVSGDGAQAQAQGYLKNAGQKDSEAEVIQGSYSYTAPDGTPITVNWIADENGFRAEGPHLPTPPPVPAEIKRSLTLRPRKTSVPTEDEDNNQYNDNEDYRNDYPRQSGYQRRYRY